MYEQDRKETLKKLGHRGLFALLVTALGACQSLDHLYQVKKIPQELQSREVLIEYLSTYNNLGYNKAFAIASDGAWGYVSSRLTISEAKRLALKSCNKYRSLGTNKCEVIDVNDKYIGNGLVDIDMKEVLGPKS